MKKYSFYVNGVLKRTGTKEEIYKISNKENCLSKADFEEVDKNGSFSYYCAGRCVLTNSEEEDKKNK